MKIAVSGTHFMGKSTLISDFLAAHPEYRTELEPYYQLQEQEDSELALEPSLDSLLNQLDFSIEQFNKCIDEDNIIFDRCPVDFIAYSMCELNQDEIDINDSEIAERFMDVKGCLNHLDVIIFIPMCDEDAIEYTEENPAYRKMADKYFKQLYRDDICDIFPTYNQPRIIELTGGRETRLKALENIICEKY
tara:strand:- start:137640 stop:138212 length:573 start_codon:yes stop_codon:yes gene_type:complete